MGRPGSRDGRRNRRPRLPRATPAESSLSRRRSIHLYVRLSFYSCRANSSRRVAEPSLCGRLEQVARARFAFMLVRCRPKTCLSSGRFRGKFRPRKINDKNRQTARAGGPILGQPSVAVDYLTATNSECAQQISPHLFPVFDLKAVHLGQRVGSQTT